MVEAGSVDQYVLFVSKGQGVLEWAECAVPDRRAPTRFRLRLLPRPGSSLARLELQGAAGVEVAELRVGERPLRLRLEPLSLEEELEVEVELSAPLPLRRRGEASPRLLLWDAEGAPLTSLPILDRAP